MNLFIIIFLILSLSSFILNQNSLSCLDQNEKPVDWYSIFIFPTNNVMMIRYIDNKQNITTEYQKENFPPNILKEKIKMDNNNDINFFSFNTNTSRAIGSLIYNEKQSIFFLSNEYDIFNSDLEFVNKKVIQLICISLNEEGTTELADSLYESEITLTLLKMKTNVKLSNSHSISKIIKGETLIEENKNDIISFGQSSQSNKQIMIFAKSYISDDLLIDSLVREYYQTGFYIKNSKKEEEEKNDCTYENMKLINVELYKFDKDQIDANSKDDTSIWAVSIEKDVVCYGDIMRLESDIHSKGILICYQDENTANTLRNSIEKYVNC